MSWQGIDDELRAVIERVCTPRQVEVLKLYAQGLGHKRVAATLGVSTKTAREHLEAASRRIRAAADDAEPGVWE